MASQNAYGNVAPPLRHGAGDYLTGVFQATPATKSFTTDEITQKSASWALSGYANTDPAGVNPSTTGIASALTDFTTGAKTGQLRWDAGTYLTTQQTFPAGSQGFRLEGDGAIYVDHWVRTPVNETLVIYTGTAGGTLFSTAGVAGHSVRDISFSGQKTSGSARAGILYSCLFQSGYPSGSHIFENVTFFHAAVGIQYGALTTDDDCANALFLMNQWWDVDICARFACVQNVDYNFHNPDAVFCGSLVNGILGGHVYITDGDFAGCGKTNWNSAASFTGAISGTTLTASGSISGTIAVGQWVVGPGVKAGTQITALGSGSGGAGTYTINKTQTVGSEAMTSVAPKVQFTGSISGTTLTVTGTPVGLLTVGMTIEAAGVNPGTMITAILTGTGGAGTFSISGVSQTVASESMTAGNWVITLGSLGPNTAVLDARGIRIEVAGAVGTMGVANLQGGQGHALFTSFEECQANQGCTQFFFGGVVATFENSRLVTNDPTHAFPCIVTSTGGGQQQGGVICRGVQFDGTTVWDPAAWFGRGFGAFRSLWMVEHCTFGSAGKELPVPDSHSHLVHGKAFCSVQSTSATGFGAGLFGNRTGYWDDPVLPSDAASSVKVTTTARKSDGSVSARFVRIIQFKNIGGDFGTNTIEDTATPFADYNPGSWVAAPTFAAGNGSIWASCPGNASQTINWGVTYELESVAANGAPV